MTGALKEYRIYIKIPWHIDIRKQRIFEAVKRVNKYICEICHRQMHMT